MPEPTPVVEDREAQESRRLSFDVPMALWNDVNRAAAEFSIAEGRSVSVSEIARRAVSKWIEERQQVAA